MDTSGYGHFPGSPLLGGGPLNREKVDLRLLAMYDRETPYYDYIFILPVHVVLDENNGYIRLKEFTEIQWHTPNLENWFGTGYTGETFALQGNASRRQLAFLSRHPSVKFVWLWNDRAKWSYSWTGIE